MSNLAKIAVLTVLAASIGACGDETGAPPPPPPVITGCNGTTIETPSRGMSHIAQPTPIEYQDTPPSSGNHRAIWGKWGEYSEISPEYWVHNLEHGGVALLYGETATSTVVDALRAYAKNRPADSTGPFRYILTPYSGLPNAIAVVAWEWTYLASGVCTGELDTFLTAHYRKTFEDIPSDGSFSENWIDR